MANKKNEKVLHELYIKATDGKSSKAEQAKNWEAYWEAKNLTNTTTK